LSSTGAPGTSTPNGLALRGEVSCGRGRLDRRRKKGVNLGRKTGFESNFRPPVSYGRTRHSPESSSARSSLPPSRKIAHHELGHPDQRGGRWLASGETFDSGIDFTAEPQDFAVEVLLAPENPRIHRSFPQADSREPLVDLVTRLLLLTPPSTAHLPGLRPEGSTSTSASMATCWLGSNKSPGYQTHMNTCSGLRRKVRSHDPIMKPPKRGGDLTL
jgi:hypothetical protein